MVLSLGFMTLVAAVNFRGVGESVKANVVLTMVELSGLLMVIFIGLYAVTQGNADFGRVMVFESPERQGHLPRDLHRLCPRVLRDGRLRGLGQHGRGVRGAQA